MATAQDAYKVMIRDHLSPQLRAQGFKGSGGAYELPSATHWIVLGVQASQSSRWDNVRFTVNCQVVRRDTWNDARRERPYLGAKPKPNTYAGNFVWWSRIGSLMPEGNDTWWHLGPSGDPHAVAQEVAMAVRDYVLPALEQAVRATDGVRQTHTH